MIIRRAGGARAGKRAAWERVLACWQRSGLGVTEFAHRHGIKAKRLFKWRAKLQARPAAPVPDRGFSELQVCSAYPSLEIHLGQARVLVPFDGNVQRLCMIRRAVREAAC